MRILVYGAGVLGGNLANNLLSLGAFDEKTPQTTW